MSCSIHDIVSHIDKHFFTKYIYVCVYVMLSLMVPCQIVPQKSLPVKIPDPDVLAFAALPGNALLKSISFEKLNMEMKITDLTFHIYGKICMRGMFPKEYIEYIM